MNPSNSVLGKSLPVSSSTHSSNQAGPATLNFEASRRPGQSGPSNATPVPRKGQASRKKHRDQHRPGPEPRTNRGLDASDAMDEIRAVRNPNSRRGQTSITHLLNYSMPRPYVDHSAYARSYRRNPTWGPGSGYHASDKSRYVHSNYRFVVSPEISYTDHASDADLHLDWNNVLQVIASSQSQVTSCPICLSDPVAPRMAKCGHIFCLSCLIRFMNSSSSEEESKSSKGPRWKKCPICEDSIYLHETRPVRFYAGQESPLPRVGDDVVLRLMARNADSTLALPSESGAEAFHSGSDIPWHFAANVFDYARIMKGTSDYMTEQYDEEIQALKQQEKEDETLFGLDGEWTQRAIRAIEGAKERLEPFKDITAASVVAPGKLFNPSTEADFYFYSSPPHLYLSPLDIRILKTKYGNFSSFPTTLLPRVEHISTGHVVDDAMRKRAKYLGHLPRGCVVTFLECDWTDIVTAETLDSFKSEIERRRKRNRDKAIQEERERVQAERIEAASMRAAAGSRHLVGPLDDEKPPAMDMSEFQPLGGHSDATPPDPRPGFETLASMSTSPSTQRTVWGTRVVAQSPELGATHIDSGDDGWLKDEDFLGPAELAAQMEALNAFESADTGKGKAIAGPSTGTPNGAGGGGKKKKKQKITLMSTGGRRGF